MPGLEFPLKGKYRPLTVSQSNAHKCWEPEYQFALREIAGETYPQAEHEPSGESPSVTFSRTNKFGFETLRQSLPLNVRRPSAAELGRVQSEIERIHELANDPDIPSDRREFFRGFQLPDPRQMPECWRTSGFFRKRLSIIWGLAKEGKNSTFLPASAASAKWGDRAERIPLGRPFGFDGLPRSATAGGIDGGGPGGRCGCLGAFLRSWPCWLTALLLGLPVCWGVRSCSSQNGVASAAVADVADAVTNAVRNVSGGMDDGLSDARGGVEPEDAVSDGGAESKTPESEGLEAESGGEEWPASSMDGPPRQTSVTNLESVRAFECRFRVDPPKELAGGDAESAKVEFTVSPVDENGGREFVVSDWTVNGRVARTGVASSFIPKNGLRHDGVYTISATVTVDGRPQRVRPYQWNGVDKPTWQILEVGRDEARDVRRYRLICCNSSSVRPVVNDWKVAFRAGGRHEAAKLAFDVEQKPLGDDVLELDWGIGRYKGAYFMEMTADVSYSLRGRDERTAHVEVFPFAHDSSADALTRAKYEAVIPKVYFCLARTQTGELVNGTAFAISGSRFLTNYHVAVGDVPESYVNSSGYRIVGPVRLTNVRGKTFHAVVEKSDRGRDLAVLRLCDKDGNAVKDVLPWYLHLADEKLLDSVSESRPRAVFAVGYPKGTVCFGPPSFTDGKAERVFRRDYAHQGRAESFETVLNYTSTKCGYSGGPLIDYQTETVLGVNFGGYVKQLEGHKAASLATSVSEVRRAFPDLLK